jgi:protein O-GlcNAc transferase
MQRGESSGVRDMFAAALRHHQAGRLGDAERLYREILQLDATHGDALHCLGVVAHQRGRNDVAVELITRAIVQSGRVPAFHNNLGNALKAQGKLQEAIACYQQALSHGPNYVEAHYNLGIALHGIGRLDEAVASYRRALHYRPEHAAANNNLGNALQEQGKLDDAVTAYQRALALKPSYAEAYGNLANVRKAQGALDDAVTFYARALALKPDHAEALNNLGIVLLEQGKPNEAAALFQKALTLKPDYALAHSNLGDALQEQGNPTDARIAYSQALSADPDLAEARLGTAIASIPLFADSVAESQNAPDSFMRALNELAAWSRTRPGKLGKSVGSHQPFYLAYRPSDVTRPLIEYGDLIGTAAAAQWPAADIAPDDTIAARSRIRIAVVSAQVRRHPVWDAILRGLIAHLDRQRFEVFLYHTGALTDAETEWAKAHVESFVQGPKPVQEWIGEIKRDRPDVLLYPEVGMDPATCALAALRLAPLQIAAWGHPVTTGLPSIDWFMSGELMEWIGADGHYREKLLRLPGTGVCTEWFEIETERWQAPPRGSDVIRFALCQQAIKFDPGDDVLLARIAKAAGPSEFWLASPKKLEWSAVRLRSRLAAAFRAEGLDPDAHLRIVPWLPRRQFLSFLDEMDIYLDCPAFSGYTTAWQAIHRGLPIVTLEGEFLRQRLAAGLLRQIGQPDGIALARDEYAQIAHSWVEEFRRPGALNARRETIRKAAVHADGNRSAIPAFEQAVIKGLRR